MARAAKKAEVATVVRGTAFAAARREARALTPRTVDVVDAAGAKVGTIDLPEELFGIEPNAAVVHQIVTAQLAARRRGTHSTKTRAEVRGGGKKPWRQKGTGRARQGSTRAPQWTHGGVAHGPKPRSYAQRVNKKMIRLALASSLSSRAAEGRIVVLDAWGLETPKTKTALGTLRAVGVSGKALAVVDGHDTPEAMSLRNIDGVHLITPDQMNAYDIVRAAWLVFTRGSLTGLTSPSGTAEPAEAPPAKPASAAPKKAAKAAKPATARAGAAAQGTPAAAESTTQPASDDPAPEPEIVQPEAATEAGTAAAVPDAAPAEEADTTPAADDQAGHTGEGDSDG